MKCRRSTGSGQIGNVNSNKGESAWRFIVRQSGAEVTAAILRVDGDTGALAGTYRNGKFIVSHFSGARPLVLELTPQKDGTLEILRNRTEKMVAVKDDRGEVEGRCRADRSVAPLEREGSDRAVQVRVPGHHRQDRCRTPTSVSAARW